MHASAPPGLVIPIPIPGDVLAEEMNTHLPPAQPPSTNSTYTGNKFDLILPCSEFYSDFQICTSYLKYMTLRRAKDQAD